MAVILCGSGGNWTHRKQWQPTRGLLLKTDCLEITIIYKTVIIHCTAHCTLRFYTTHSLWRNCIFDSTFSVFAQCACIGIDTPSVGHRKT